jgi:prevent-host-death family protein
VDPVAEEVAIQCVSVCTGVEVLGAGSSRSRKRGNLLDLAKNLVYRNLGFMEVNIHHAKTHLSRLLEKVALGEEIVIAKAGEPVAKLVPIAKASHGRNLGSAKGDFVVPKDFDKPLPKAIEKSFWK